MGRLQYQCTHKPLRSHTRYSAHKAINSRSFMFGFEALQFDIAAVKARSQDLGIRIVRNGYFKGGFLNLTWHRIAHF
jgi:hypothetical protein